MSMATTRRKPLSRERILDTALALVDEEGIEALSMRKLGQALGYEAMSLYNHVANKDDLLDAVLDAHIIGFSLWASTHGKMPEHIEDARAWFDEMIPVATLPYLHEHGLQHLDEGPHHDVSAFEFALDLLLGGFDRLR